MAIKYKKSGIIIGRFQPFHNGHLEYVLKALENCDELYIGVTTPGEKPTPYEPQYPERFLPENNPYSYEQRLEMIRESLEENSADFGRVHFIHFVPTDIEAWYKAVPKDATYFLLTMPGEEKKAEEMRGHGLQVVKLEHENVKQVTAGQVRKLIEEGKPWEHLVPKAVAKVLKLKTLNI